MKPEDFVVSSEQDLRTAADLIEKDEDDILSLEETLPIPLSLVWENLLADDCKFKFTDFLKIKESTEIVEEEWKDGPPDIPSDNAEGVFFDLSDVDE